MNSVTDEEPVTRCMVLRILDAKTFLFELLMSFSVAKAFLITKGYLVSGLFLWLWLFLLVLRYLQSHVDRDGDPVDAGWF
jgi:hypothetical protein